MEQPVKRLERALFTIVDFYVFEFSVPPEDFNEIIVRIKECSLFFGPHNVANETSAFFHYIGPIQMQFPNNYSAIMTFGSIELFYEDHRIQIHNNSLTRAENMLNIMRYIILGNSYGNSKNISVTDMTIEVSLNSSMKDKSRVKNEATKLAKTFEEFILGTVDVKIDKMSFEYRSCFYCGKRHSKEEKLQSCSACTGRKKALYCSRECQKRYYYHYHYCYYYYFYYFYYYHSHWNYHKEKAGH